MLNNFQSREVVKPSPQFPKSTQVLNPQVKPSHRSNIYRIQKPAEFQTQFKTTQVPIYEIKHSRKYLSSNPVKAQVPRR